jgi:hypothetical protein
MRRRRIESGRDQAKIGDEPVKRLGRLLVGGAIAVGFALPVVTATTTVAGATNSTLHLKSPWTGAPFSTNAPSVSVTAGVVSFRGAIAASGGNTNNEPFVLPKAYRPAVDVYVPADMCGATNGRLIIEPTGVTLVQQQDGKLNQANCFVSLDGVSFVQSSAVTPLTLINGWNDTAFGTANPAAAVVKGVVHFQGAIAASSPSSAEPFVLPSTMRPSVPVFVAVDMCDATNGRLIIQPSGAVTLQEEDQGTSSEDCFTSLDGASFVLHPKNSSALKLKNGWSGAAFGTAAAAVQFSNGVVRFQGGVESGSSAQIGKLPASMTPTKDLYVKVDLCDASENGRLEIEPSGMVLVEEEDGGFATAQCFTSLDGASFVK